MADIAQLIHRLNVSVPAVDPSKAQHLGYEAADALKEQAAALDAAHKRIAELEAALLMSPMAERVADLPDFMVALSEWGCEEPSEQASAITAFLNSSVGLREYLEDQSKAGGRDGN